MKLFRVFKRHEPNRGEVDFDNVINSSFHAQQLFSDLKRKCHPDRFPNDEQKKDLALQLFQEVMKCKSDYKKLKELEIRIINLVENTKDE